MPLHEVVETFGVAGGDTGQDDRAWRGQVPPSRGYRCCRWTFEELSLGDRCLRDRPGGLEPVGVGFDRVQDDGAHGPGQTPPHFLLSVLHPVELVIDLGG